MKQGVIKKAERGFTLVELLVALMLFSLIALVATSMTASATRSFATTETVLANLAEVDRLRTLLEADLGQALRRPTLTAEGAPLSAFTLTETGFVFVRRRAAGAIPEAEKISWGLIDGQLIRQPFAALDGAPPAAPMVMMRGVQSIRLMVATERGWLAQWSPAEADDLPLALEITIQPEKRPPFTLRLMVAS